MEMFRPRFRSKASVVGVGTRETSVEVKWIVGKEKRAEFQIYNTLKLHS